MSLNETQSKILKPFIEETIHTLKDMAGLDATSGDGFQDSVEQFRFKGYAVAANTSGNLRGKLLMHLYLETALEIGNKVNALVLGDTEEHYEVTDKISEALEEFGNTAIGLATRGLDEAKLGIRFEPPFFILKVDELEQLLTDVKEIISIPIHVNNVGRFYFNFLLEDVTEN
ncbi:MAG TPA: hypothetical protein DCZ03_06680 [Gammaproteobacteria bacterium]|nr:hypothetical protein [Gammaproteobacteria bacterium]